MTSLFVDEGKARGYVIVAATVADADVTQLRKDVSKLRLPKQRKRVHFVDESDGRRRSILSELARLGVRTHVYQATGLDDRAARAWCLDNIAELAAALSARRIVIETDDSIVESDRRTLYRALDQRGLRESVAYTHMRASSEALLWVPDAVAWSYGRGGEWAPRVEPLIEEVVSYPA